MRVIVLCCAAVVALSPGRLAAQDSSPSPLGLLDVPFLSQSEALCGGAAAAMVLRFWGERGITAESFADLVDRSAAGIRTDVLTSDLQRRGWNAVGLAGTAMLLEGELARGRPILTLIEDRPGTFHYVVLVGWHERGVVFHDPARGPFVVMSRAAFEQRWARADRWMAVVTPGAMKPGAPAPPPASTPGGTCADVVAASVRLAESNDLQGAERLLASAATCPAAARELAGIRILQKRWVEAEDLATSAIEQGDTDGYAWQVLATSRFVQNDRAGALDAWNRVGEPRVDLVRIDGLGRTRHRVVERLIHVPSGSLLTADALLRARRRLAALPAASTTRLDYVPVSGGLAEIRGVVGERGLLPSGRLTLTALALTAAATREVTLTTGSPTGGGEQMWASWRFWPARRRLAGGINAPAAWGGLWSVEAATGSQEFTESFPETDRRSVRVGVTDWLTGRVRFALGAGIEEWNGENARPVWTGGLRFTSADDRFTAEIGGGSWLLDEGFASIAASASARSSTQRVGTVWFATGTAGVVGANAPMDLWLAGDTGHARPTLLRAHPVLDGGRLRTDRLGRRLLHMTAEVQRWESVRSLIYVGGAIFVDSVLTGRRLDRPARGDVDIGVGLRLAIAGAPGVFRVDVARGLRDAAHVVSIAYQP